MNHRAISSFLVITVAAAGWWALQREQAPAPESNEVASSHDVTERLPHHDALPLPVELERPPVAPASTSSGPLIRQRDRLLATEARLAARRDEAQASGASEATVQALDAHIARIEQRLTVLDVTPKAGITETSASREATSAEPRP